MTPIERMLAEIEVDPDRLCWRWTGRLDHKGYPRIPLGGRHNDVRVHRFAYEFFRGEIPAGFEVVRRCDERLCVNPDHMTVKRGAGKARTLSCYERSPEQVGERQADYSYVRLVCGQGHWVLADNAVTVTTASGEVARRCRTCLAERHAHLLEREIEPDPREAYRERIRALRAARLAVAS